MIAWRYIDKTAAAIAVIRDYLGMRNIINVTPQEIKELYARMASPRSSKITGMPATHNPRSVENKIADSLDKLDVMLLRYMQAIAYMAWFEPCWGSLTDDEQLILREYYMSGNQKSGATTRLEELLNYRSAQIERMRCKALTRLAHFLYSK